MPPLIMTSSSNISGNISSCTTNVQILNCASRNSLFTCQDIGFATNNCTGQTQQFESWSLTGFSIFLMVLVEIIVLCVGIKFASDF